jgi:hypothetical protein
MLFLKTKIDRALAFVHAAIEDPTDQPLRDANQHAAEVLDELDTFILRPELRGEVAQLTVALKTLKHILWQQPLQLSELLPRLTRSELIPDRTLRAL